MDREETKKIIMAMTVYYPNFKPTCDVSYMIDLWKEALEDYDYENVNMALKTYVNTDTSGFAPSIGQLIGKMNVVDELNELNEMEAWTLVRNALCDSIYHAQERFNELPDTVKKAVGSADILRAWGTDEDYNENVAQSQFMRCYRNVLERKKEIAKLPTSVRTLIGNTTQKMIGG